MTASRLSAAALLTAALSVLPAGLCAQSLYETLEERNPTGRILSMEDVIDRSRMPRHKPYHWDADGILQEGPAAARAPRAFSLDGSLYLVTGADTLCIARSEEDGIVYGTAVSRNEFGIRDGIFWSPDSSKVAFYRKDERAVAKYPLPDVSARGAGVREVRYPMNGTSGTEVISLGIYDVASSGTHYLQCEDFGSDRYLAGISWSPDASRLFVHVLDRSQHHLRLNMYDTSDGSFIRTLLTEDNDAWVEPQEPLRHFKGGKYIYTTDNRDGYSSLYLVDSAGRVDRVTPVDADVHFVATDGNYIFYSSAEISPAESHLYKVRVGISRGGSVRLARPEALTPERGVHRCSLNSDCTRIFDCWSSVSEPGRAVERDSDGNILQDLYSLEDPLAEYAVCGMAFGTVKSADGAYDNHFRMFRPLGFDPSRKYPVIVYVYGGPHSQMVTDTWLGGIRLWEMAMAQRGYIVYVQDNRGTLNHGSAYEKSVNRRLGQAEMEDQVAGIREAVLSQPWADADRVGVSGWSFGGFMTISLMTSYPDIFKAGACGGPVIDWKWYEVMYGERYMDTPETNPDGFALTSLLDKADRLEGHLLICQGGLDDTVLPIHSLSFVQACVESGTLAYYFPYMRSRHNVAGPWRAQMYRLFTDFFETNL